MATWPTPEQIETFLAGPPDRPVVMLNLLSFKEQAADGSTGHDAVMRYSRAMREFVEARGGTFVIAADVDSQVIGEGGEHFEFVAIMRYPSRQKYLELAGDPEVARTIGKHREAGLESQWLFAMTELTR
jgi:uncharacterized protein (DUF1330 family)